MSPAVVFMFAILVLVPTSEAQDLKQRTCNETLYKDTCAQSLANSTATDVKGLATDAMRALVTVGENALKTIEAVKGSSKGSILDHLNTCVEIYESTNNHTLDAVKALEASNTDDAIIQVSAAMRVQRSCDDGFKKDSLKNPVDDLHPLWVKQANVALTICTLANPTGGSVPVV